MLADLAGSTDPALPSDLYGEGEMLARFEARIAAELGKPAAVFMPSGTLAQQIALRIWCDRAGISTVAMHPLSHPVIHESKSLEFVQRLTVVPVGLPARLMTPDDLATLATPIAALLVELPQREIGAQLPSWDELQRLVAVAREGGIKLHLDGARLWEAAPHYERSHAEIAAPFDSVYVSFYKGLDAIAGAALAGDEDFIAEARVWQHRLGGKLVALYPLALSAEAGYDRYLPRMAAYRQRARDIAALLSGADGIDVVPDPPHTNTLHIFLRGTHDALTARADVIAREQGIAAFRRLAPTPSPNLWKWEFVVGEATFAFETTEVAAVIRQLAGHGGPTTVCIKPANGYMECMDAHDDFDNDRTQPTPPRVHEMPVTGSGGEERLREAERLEHGEPPRPGAEPNVEQ